MRNLNLSHGSRSRGKTIADDEYNLATPAKQLLREDAQTLHHAKSYDQLSKAHDGDDVFASPERASTNGDGPPSIRKARPMRGNMRRRSTLHWASSNPRSRQQKLEALEVNRLLTSWFSIHHGTDKEPIYISEVIEHSMNPSFSLFDLDSALADMTRSDEFVLRVWAKNELADEYLILVEISVNLRSLQFLGRSLENFQHPLPENCVLFHLSDGIYTSFTNLPGEGQHQPAQTPAMKSMKPVSASSFDALLKLSNLDEVIQDALRTRAKLEADINKLLANMPPAEDALSHLSSQREDSKNAKKACEHERKQIEHMKRMKDDTIASLRSRRQLIPASSGTQANLSSLIHKQAVSTETVRKEIDSQTELSNSQLRRIITSLTRIFPIEPIKSRTLQFTIRNIHLPNSSFSDTNSDEIAAALGFTAQLIHSLSLYLSVPLPYRIIPNGSESLINDDISAGIAQRQFPLYPSGAAYKFDYGVFLLNKDIEFLMNRSGLRAMDIRHTLPNLKYLCFVLTAGDGELPDRKAGGVRALLRGRGSVTPEMSRRNSEESVTSAMSDSKLAEKEKDEDDVFAGSLRARALPYRRSMLRDAG